jgi:hypothetical protein
MVPDEHMTMDLHRVVLGEAHKGIGPSEVVSVPLRPQRSELHDALWNHEVKFAGERLPVHVVVNKRPFVHCRPDQDFPCLG